MKILSHLDREDLKPGEYILVGLERQPREAHRIDKRLRALVLERDGFTCQLCGAGAGELRADGTRRTRLHVDHIDPNGPTTEPNLRTLCSECNEGRANLALPPSSVNLLASVRRSSRDDQRIVYDWLRNKFEAGGKPGEADQ